MMERTENLEISLWHNGQAVTETGILYTARISSHAESSFWLASLAVKGPQYQIRLRWNAEIVDDWVGAEMWIVDGEGVPVASPRPTLVYLGPSAFPMTTPFLCGWQHHLPSRAGVWVVAIRLGDTILDLKAKYQQLEME